MIPKLSGLKQTSTIFYSFRSNWVQPTLKGKGLHRWVTTQRQGSLEAVLKAWVSKWVKSLRCVRLFATPWTVAHQAPPSMGFSRQEYWSGLPFPSPGVLPDPKAYLLPFLSPKVVPHVWASQVHFRGWKPVCGINNFFDRWESCRISGSFIIFLGCYFPWQQMMKWKA